MKIKNGQLEVIIKVLNATEGILSLADARIRDKFGKTLSEAQQLFNANKELIFKKFCTKKEDGTPDTKPGDTPGKIQYHFTNEVTEELNKELLTLINEEVEVEKNDKIKEIVKDSPYKPLIGEAEIIDAFSALF